MRTSLTRIAPGVAVMLSMASALAAAAPAFAPPPTPARPVVDTVHGVKLTDSYRWLENGRDPEVEAWTKRQHDATVAWLDANAPMVAGLHDELVAYFDRDITQPPFFKKGREFFYRTRKGEAQAKIYTRIEETERLIFDPLALDPSGKTSVGAFVLNRDASRAAVATYSRGSEITDFRVIDTRTGEQIGPLLPGTQSFAWPHDERYAFISPRTKESIERQEPQRCYRHKLGDDHRNDELLIAMKDAKDYCSVFEPEDAELTVFETGDFYSNTLRIRAVGSTAEPKTIYSSKEFRANADFRKDRIYIVTNDHAPNFKLMVASYQAPVFEEWKVLWPEQDTVLDGVDVTTDWLLVRDKKDVLTRVWVHDLEGKRVRELPLPELGNISASAYDKDKNVVYATLSTFTAPGRLYEIDGKKLSWSLIWEDKPPLDTSQIESKLVFYKSKDGTRVPMFLTYRKGTRQDGTNPVFLHGYGGFNIGIGPDYVRSWATFINRGGVLAEAGIRGGDEYGERWHDAAKFGNKQNSFDDFIAAAEWLVREKYTTRERLMVGGGSNGGLLIGAMLTQRPDLFGAALCQVPLLDMVRFHKFLIARYWIAEYGDPDKAEDFAYILRYSPYQNIREGINFPTTLVTAGEYDSRVDPLHAKKFVAAVQNHVGQIDPFLLYMDFDSGHGYGKAKEQVIRDREYELRFIFSRVGMR
ncbi:MAG TPA: prolyl oligopeptidase family serine peptidase [Casimicrobiaceae bacterium]|nr:prolyl oligopeptidase family serine peptidase [Casimicrobiaceae bacterium]